MMMQWVTFLEAAQQVKQSLDAISTIGKFVQLKKRGRNHLGLCPFHNEKSPSFNVSAERGLFKCFGCGESGDSISFLMKIENKTYGDVIREQAETLGLSIKASNQADEQAFQKQLDDKQKLLQLMQLATQFYQSHLTSPAGASAKAYLEESRGYTLTQLAPFQLGASPDGWDALTTYLLSALPFLQQEPQWLETAGLASPRQNNNGYYDKFRDRLLFPIHNPKGEVVAFGGRAFSAEVQPKYLNSPETPLYHKSSTLYGFFQGKETIRKRKRAIVMEGYFDVLATHLAGFSEAVATCGTALTEDHLKLLMKSGIEQLFLCFDSDKAGQAAALSGIARIEPLLERHPIKVKVIALPNGKDPDDFFKSENSQSVFEGLLSTAPDYLDFQLACALQGFNLQLTDEQFEAGYKVLPLLAKVKNPMRKAHLLAKYADVLHTPEEALRQSLQQFEKRQPKPTYNNNVGQQQASVTNVTANPSLSAQADLHTALSPQKHPHSFQHYPFDDSVQTGYSKPFKPKPKNGKYLTATEKLAVQASLENHTHYRQRLLQQQSLPTLEQTAMAQLLATQLGFVQLKPLLAPLVKNWQYAPFGLLWQMIEAAPSVAVIRPHLPAPLHPLWDNLLFEADRWHELLALSSENEQEALQQVKTALSQTVQRWQERKTQENLTKRNKQLKQEWLSMPASQSEASLFPGEVETPESIEKQASHEVSSIELQYEIVENHPSV
jgi:DNA primase